MNRRGFLAALIGGATLDPERLLWRPGKKLVSIPRVTVPPLSPLQELTIRAYCFGQGRRLFNPHADLYRAYEHARAEILGLTARRI